MTAYSNCNTFYLIHLHILHVLEWLQYLSKFILHLHELQNVSFSFQTEQVAFLCILFTFIIIGNSSVLVAILLSKNRKSRMNFFIMQLAIAGQSSITFLIMQLAIAG